MVHRSSSLEEIRELVKSCLIELYDRDRVLFERRDRVGVREECLVFRFAHYLQNRVGTAFFVDCEFDAAYDHEKGEELSEKKLKDSEGEEHARLVDIIVHTRELNRSSDFICFEFKKSSNNDNEGHQKDIDNLADLTHTYGYLYGFHIILGEVLEETRWTIFTRGEENSRMIVNERIVSFCS